MKVIVIDTKRDGYEWMAVYTDVIPRVGEYIDDNGIARKVVGVSHHLRGEPKVHVSIK